MSIKYFMNDFDWKFLDGIIIYTNRKHLKNIFEAFIIIVFIRILTIDPTIAIRNILKFMFFIV